MPRGVVFLIRVIKLWSKKHVHIHMADWNTAFSWHRLTTRIDWAVYQPTCCYTGHHDGMVSKWISKNIKEYLASVPEADRVEKWRQNKNGGKNISAEITETFLLCCRNMLFFQCACYLCLDPCAVLLLSLGKKGIWKTAVNYLYQS